MREHNSNIPLFEPARGGCQLAGEPHEAAVLLDSPNKIDVLKQREWLEPAKRLINAAPHKDTNLRSRDRAAETMDTRSSTAALP